MSYRYHDNKNVKTESSARVWDPQKWNIELLE